MAHYTAVVESPLSPDEAFAYVSDLRNFEEWDPGVSSSKLVVGAKPGAGAEYDVKANGASLRYKTKEFRVGAETFVVAKTRFFESLDRITVAESSLGSRVTYDARLELNGVLGVADPVLQLAFDRIGSKAAEGLTKALRGNRVS